MFCHYNYAEASPFSVSGITTESATASIGSTIWTDRPSYLIAQMPNELPGSTVFQPVHYVDIATITVSSTIDANIRVATRDDRDGGLMDVLPADGWTLEDGWFVEWTGVQNNEMLNKILSKQISAGESVTFTTTKDAMTFAIFASEGNKFYISL